ncbi:MAG: TlpA family protein disulfide reductase [Comamonadaceae bacterium]|nr:TlpA family protein disulfide reductase [Comamonadaceae bacterium]
MNAMPASSSVPMRRRWLVAGAALAAAAAGGAAWWRWAPADAHPEALLWTQTFSRPDGQPLALAGLRGQPLLLNFWATWCPPCIEELPLLNRFYAERRAQGWQVLGLAVDQVAAVQKFLQRQPLDFPVAIAGPGGAQLGRSLGNLQGGLPFTVVLGADGRIRHRKMGQVKVEDLQRWTAA